MGSFNREGLEKAIDMYACSSRTSPSRTRSAEKRNLQRPDIRRNRFHVITLETTWHSSWSYTEIPVNFDNEKQYTWAIGMAKRPKDRCGKGQ